MSSETKFTPGPWKAFFGTENNRVLIGIGEETGEGITDCGDRYWRGQFGMWRGKDEDAAANAHLIAAAPDLYAALEIATAYARQCGWHLAAAATDDPVEREFAEKLVAAADCMSAALAKARGETL